MSEYSKMTFDECQKMWANHPDLLTAKKAMEILGIKKTKLYSLINRGFPATKIGKEYMILKKCLIEYFVSRINSNIEAVNDNIRTAGTNIENMECERAPPV